MLFHWSLWSKMISIMIHFTFYKKFATDFRRFQRYSELCNHHLENSELQEKRVVKNWVDSSSQVNEGGRYYASQILCIQPWKATIKIGISCNRTISAMKIQHSGRSGPLRLGCGFRFHTIWRQPVYSLPLPWKEHETAWNAGPLGRFSNRSTQVYQLVKW